MPDVFEGARNLVAGRGYIIVEAMRRGEPAGPYFLRLDKAIDHVVDAGDRHRPEPSRLADRAGAAPPAAAGCLARSGG